MFLSHAFLKVLGPGLFGAWLCVVGVSASLADEVNRPATELEVLKKKIERLQKQMASRRKEESSALSDLDSSEREIAKLDQTHERLVAQAKSESVKLESLSNEWLSLTQNDVRSKDAFQALLRSGYILHRQGGMRLFFDGKDPAEVGRSRFLLFCSQKDGESAPQAASAAIPADPRNHLPLLGRQPDLHHPLNCPFHWSRD